MIEVTIEQMYAEACRKVGELTLTSGVLQAEIARLAAENDALRAQRPADASGPDDVE